MGFMDEIRKIPPVTRFLLASTIGITLPLLGGLISSYPIFFSWYRVKNHFEVSMRPSLCIGSPTALIFALADMEGIYILLLRRQALLALELNHVTHCYSAYLHVYSGSGIPLIFDFAMLYRNSNALEEVHYPRRSADYAYHLILSAVSILVSRAIIAV
jgi:Derlin-2/3